MALSKKDVKLQTLCGVIDPLLAVMRLQFPVVKAAYKSYLSQLRQQHDINRVFLHTEEVLIFFSPNEVDVLRPIVEKLEEKSPKGESLVPLVDVFTILTMILRGEISEKGIFLFELYNLSKQSILSETEHALMIFRMSTSLRKIGILGRLDFTMDDIKHAAFIARYIPDRDVFVPGLSPEELTDWLTTSNVGKAASGFISVLTRLLKVCLRLDGKAASLLAWLEQMTTHHEFDLPIPRLDFSTASLHPSRVFVVYRGINTVSLALSSSLLKGNEIFVQCNKHMRFSKTSEKYFKLISYRRSRVALWSGQCDLLSRVDIDGLDADSEYSFVAYQVATKLRYPTVELRTLTESGLTSRFETVRCIDRTFVHAEVI